MPGEPGRDGEDGDAYISYTWIFGPITFAMDDPAVSGLSYIINGNYYSANVGTWTYSYEAWDGSIWYGTYTIYINEGELGEPGEPGEPGDWFWQDGKDGADGTDGADGKDICFELSCLSIGPSFYGWSCTWGKSIPIQDKYEQQHIDENTKAQNSGYLLKYSDQGAQNADILTMDYVLDLSDPGVYIEEGRQGKYSYIHVYEQIK